MELPENFPTTALAFEKYFATEEQCEAYLFGLRWPEGFRCPRCKGEKAWALRSRPGLIECACGRQTSLRAGTVFEGSRKPLTLWFRAMFLMVGQKSGLSAKNFMRLMGIASYQTAWTWLHKLRKAMVLPGRTKLSGEVEMDETYVSTGEESSGKRGRGTSKTMVVAAVELEAKGKAMGRVRMEVIEGASAEELGTFAKTNVEPGTTVRSDGLKEYGQLQTDGFRHRPTVVGKPENASKVLPNVHRVFALLKRWLLGTHQGAAQTKHIPAYLNEFSFRFNRRRSSHPVKLFHRLAQQAVLTPAITYAALVGTPVT